jgi:squalene-hopene/tetraprenyl-beta-curcumene cyclase
MERTMRTKPLALLILAGAVAAGPDDLSKDAIEKGVAWLRAQAKGGVWMTRHGEQEVPSPAHTALALAAVARSLPADARMKDPLVKSAVAFLLKAQREDGAIEAGNAYYENYFTSATVMALAEIGDPAHQAALEKMRAYLLSIQRKEEGRTEGGFGYNKSKGADLSNAQFAIEALRAAGLPEDHEAMVKARAFLERVQNRSENEANQDAIWEVEEEKLGKVKVVPGNDGSAGYEPGVSKAGLQKLPDGTYVTRGYGSMTYALLKCYILAGLPPEDERVQAAVKWLASNYTWDENPGFRAAAEETGQKDAPYWGLYYYYVTAAKALRAAGIKELTTPEGARDWRVDLEKAIVSRQGEDGSWRNERSPRWEEGDPLITTAYAVTALQEIAAAR